MRWTKSYKIHHTSDKVTCTIKAFPLKKKKECLTTLKTTFSCKKPMSSHTTPHIQIANKHHDPLRTTKMQFATAMAAVLAVAVAQAMKLLKCFQL